ncbi:unnamed protein product [Bursaphelenchus okinawaensis]|uniref:Uncharacterized protein n=1 Tax=Bursaphelenchus okinawaensis TaxID=465554 RepID=A0A811K207_9BILA|nr:unnamed protein product [Bursaphelenchus okinawaensis]CAG9089365.1 unnamed protein product [Bursaphelenchus okinawaensis]
MEGSPNGLKAPFKDTKKLTQITYHVFNEKFAPIALHRVLPDLITIKGSDLITLISGKEGLNADDLLFFEYYNVSAAKIEDIDENMLVMGGSEVFLVYDYTGLILSRHEEFTELPVELQIYSLPALLKESPQCQIVLEKLTDGIDLSELEMKEMSKLLAQKLQNYVFTRPAKRTERSAWLRHLFAPYPKFDLRQILQRTGPHPHKFDAFLFNTFFNAKTKRRRMFKKFAETGDCI